MTPERYDFGIPLVDAEGKATGERASVTLYVSGHRDDQPIWEGGIGKVFTKNHDSPDDARKALVRHLRTIADALEKTKV